MSVSKRPPPPPQIPPFSSKIPPCEGRKERSKMVRVPANQSNPAEKYHQTANERKPAWILGLRGFFLKYHQMTVRSTPKIAPTIPGFHTTASDDVGPNIVDSKGFYAGFLDALGR
jgi:hypothetical protein